MSNKVFGTISRPNLNANGKGKVSASSERCWKLNAGQGDSSLRRAPWPISSGSDPCFYGGTIPCPPDSDGQDEPEPRFNRTVNMKHQSLVRPALHPLTLSNWMYDVMADLTSIKPSVPASEAVAPRESERVSRFVPIAASALMDDGMGRRPSSVQVLPYSAMTPGVTLPPSAHTVASRRSSLQFTPTSLTFLNWSYSRTTLGMKKLDEDEDVFEKEKRVVEMSGSRAAGSREKRLGSGGTMPIWVPPLPTVKVEPKNKRSSPAHEHEENEELFHRSAF